MTGRTQVNGSRLIGKRVTLQVNSTPSPCAYPEAMPLRQTTSGTLRRFERWPAGRFGFLETDRGTLICFDAGLDLQNRTVEIVVDPDTL